MDYCYIFKRSKEFSGMSVAEFSKKILHCGTTQYNRLINHKTYPTVQMRRNVSNYLEKSILEGQDDFYNFVFTENIVSKVLLKLNIGDVLSSYDTKSLILLISISLSILENRTNKLKDLHLLDEVEKYITTDEKLNLHNLKDHIFKLK